MIDFEKIDLFISTNWAELVREELKNRRYSVSIEEIAQKCNVSTVTIYKFMNNDRKSVKIELLQAILAYLKEHNY